jgi:hypothetical protein
MRFFMKNAEDEQDEQDWEKEVKEPVRAQGGPAAKVNPRKIPSCKSF